MMDQLLVVKDLGRQDYLAVWEQMKAFTESRGGDTADEIWFVEHDPVFTLGQAGKEEHLLAPGDIPVVRTDRGGQVTYHGPGQIVCYLLLDLKRLNLGVRQLVTLIEQSLVGLLDNAGVNANARREAPGVYVDGRKVASLGLRIRKGCSYHGLSLNVDMDLAPFSRINPCGYAGLELTDLRHLGVSTDRSELCQALIDILARQIGYDGAPKIRVM